MVKTAFNATGEQPTLLRSALTSCTIRALVPDAGAAAFEVLGDVGVAEAEVVALGVVEGVGILALAAVFFAMLVGLAVLGLGFAFVAVGFGVPTGALGDCDAAELGSLCAVPFQPRVQSLRSVRFRSASFLPSSAAVFAALWSWYPLLSCQSLQASATDGTPRVVMVTAAMTIRR
ncbi:hypothetical protein ACWGA9_18510 [Streptomyces sp. NPDC054950]